MRNTKLEEKYFVFHIVIEYASTKYIKKQKCTSKIFLKQKQTKLYIGPREIPFSHMFKRIVYICNSLFCLLKFRFFMEFVKCTCKKVLSCFEVCLKSETIIVYFQIELQKMHVLGLKKK